MPSYAGVDNPGMLRSGARAGSIIVWIGGPITVGGGAGSDADRMSTLASAQLDLTEKNYASVTAKVSDGLVTRCYAARDDTSYDHAQVAYVVLAGGLEDPVSALSAVISKSKDAVNECHKAFPNARIVWAASPGSLAGMPDEKLADTSTVTAAILGQARATDCLAIDMRKVLGTDTALQATGILPNAEGHERLAEVLIDAIRDDQGQPIDQPITPGRNYSSGLTDWASRQVEATRRREAEKREANRPTGTELGGVTQKLDELTQAQNVQQVLLEQQQDELDEHQQELEAQQQKLQSQQTQLTKHQNELEAQQKSLKSAQDAIKQAQDQLAKIVGDQGDQVNTLKTLTESLQKTDEKIDTIQRTLWENQQKLDNRIDKLDERVQKLENGTSA
ncbi:hypothetical protein PG2072B_0993 [Bifidobacterium pseudolongum subsp. globosum]|uniref:Uncharacterized protein n=1 Tax=Bifidobacterium pseudolongum subsp. globosum TaxID=1690 RepID=A0A4Q5BAE9_9BIFI|nr:SGNH/GDSL hydrolase family protein [Bifidobacterium pseudolongum]RYQ68390.1 hypothetical protein PG2072B_0993 [Bifidobacterium pseudolongum subsp. globosum]